MQTKYMNKNTCRLTFSQGEIAGIAKCSVYISELERIIKTGKLREKQALFESLVDFLLDIRNGFLQIVN